MSYLKFLPDLHIQITEEKITKAATNFNIYKFNAQWGQKIEIKVALTLFELLSASMEDWNVNVFLDWGLARECVVWWEHISVFILYYEKERFILLINMKSKGEILFMWKKGFAM